MYNLQRGCTFVFQVWSCSQGWTPLCLNSSSSFSSRTKLVPLRPFTTSQAHKKYSWTRSAVQPKDNRQTSWFSPSVKRVNGFKLKRIKWEEWVSNRQACSGSGLLGCTVCPPASPAWPGGCSVVHALLVDASFPAWASFCHQSPPEQYGPRQVQMLLGALRGKCLCPRWCHEVEQPVAQDHIQHQHRIPNSPQDGTVRLVANLQNLNVHHSTFMAQDSSHSLQVHTEQKTLERSFTFPPTSVKYVTWYQNLVLFRNYFCLIVALISLE